MGYVASKAVSANGSETVKALVAAGIIPPECVRFELLISPNRAVTMCFEVYATEEQLQAIGDALKRYPEEAMRVITPVASLRRVQQGMIQNRTKLAGDVEEYALVRDEPETGRVYDRPKIMDMFRTPKE